MKATPHCINGSDMSYLYSELTRGAHHQSPRGRHKQKKPSLRERAQNDLHNPNVIPELE